MPCIILQNHCCPARAGWRATLQTEPTPPHPASAATQAALYSADSGGPSPSSLKQDHLAWPLGVGGPRLDSPCLNARPNSRVLTWWRFANCCYTPVSPCVANSSLKLETDAEPVKRRLVPSETNRFVPQAKEGKKSESSYLHLCLMKLILRLLG
jgi:hypothetical protein